MKLIATARYPGEIWDIGRGIKVGGVHLRVDCITDDGDQPCMFHSPTDHIMSDFPHHWRADRMIMERLCEHGVGHPDPDQLQYWMNTRGGDAANAEMVHGCDGCCADVVEIDIVKDEGLPWPIVHVTQHDHVMGIFADTCSACIDNMAKMSTSSSGADDDTQDSEERPVTHSQLADAVFRLEALETLIRAIHPGTDLRHVVDPECAACDQPRSSVRHADTNLYNFHLFVVGL